VRNKRLTVLLIIAAAAAAAAFVQPPAPPAEAPDAGLLPAPRAAASAAAPGELGSLPERETIGERRGELFASRSWAPPRQSRPKAAPVAAAPPPPPAPPMPYRVAGRVAHGGDARVVLARGEAVLTVREGDMLDGGYRVESIAADRVTLHYGPLDLRHDLAMYPRCSIRRAPRPPRRCRPCPARPAQPALDGRSRCAPATRSRWS
jgi:hypothetical protein